MQMQPNRELAAGLLVRFHITPIQQSCNFSGQKIFKTCNLWKLLSVKFVNWQF